MNDNYIKSQKLVGIKKNVACFLLKKNLGYVCMVIFVNRNIGGENILYYTVFVCFLVYIREYNLKEHNIPIMYYYYYYYL